MSAVKAFHTEELHGVFAVTIYGDRIRVAHYSDWNTAIELWDLCDTNKRKFGSWGIVKFFCVRSWTDPDWNLSRYRSFNSLIMAAENAE